MIKVRNCALVLSSGGARGLAHIGAIEALESQNFHIKAVAGCSIGSVVGGIYAKGELNVFKDWICNLDKIDVFKLFDFTFSSQGFMRGERVFAEMQKMIPDVNIEDLPIPFVAVAANISQNKEVRFQENSLFDAIRASVAIPSVMKPVILENDVLVDGGIVNPIPINCIKKQEDELLVVVNLNANTPYQKELQTEQQQAEEQGYLQKIESFKQKWIGLLPKSEPKQKTLGFFELLNRSFDMAQDKLAEFSLKEHQPDILVNISRESCGTFEFYRANEMIEYGKQKTLEAIEEWKKRQILLKNKDRFWF